MAAVTFGVKYWKDEFQVGREESSIILLSEVDIGGRPVRYREASITWEASEHNGKQGVTDFLILKLEGVPDEDFAKWSPDEYAMGSGNGTLFLPISTLDILEV